MINYKNNIKFKDLTEIEKTTKCQNCEITFIKKYSYMKFCNKDCKDNFHFKRINKGRFLIFSRDNFTCIYCGKNTIEDKIKLVVDHIIPKESGGKNTTINLVTSCNDCNIEKSYKDLSLQNNEKIKNEIQKRNLLNNLLDDLTIKLRPDGK